MSASNSNVNLIEEEGTPSKQQTKGKQGSNKPRILPQPGRYPVLIQTRLYANAGAQRTFEFTPPRIDDIISRYVVKKRTEVRSELMDRNVLTSALILALAKKIVRASSLDLFPDTLAFLDNQDFDIPSVFHQMLDLFGDFEYNFKGYKLSDATNVVCKLFLCSYLVLEHNMNFEDAWQLVYGFVYDTDESTFSIPHTFIGNAWQRPHLLWLEKAFGGKQSTSTETISHQPLRVKVNYDISADDAPVALDQQRNWFAGIFDYPFWLSVTIDDPAHPQQVINPDNGQQIPNPDPPARILAEANLHPLVQLNHINQMVQYIGQLNNIYFEDINGICYIRDNFYKYIFKSVRTAYNNMRYVYNGKMKTTSTSSFCDSGTPVQMTYFDDFTGTLYSSYNVSGSDITAGVILSMNKHSFKAKFQSPFIDRDEIILKILEQQ